MSKYENMIVDCPYCNKEFSTKIWHSANVTLDPYLKDEIKEGEFNLIICPGCGGVGSSPLPVLYHDMDKKLMIYVMPKANQEELQDGKRDVEESLKESSKGREPQHNVYVLDSMDDLQDIVIRLESAQYADGSFPEDLGPEDWKYLVDTIIAPERPWPLDHKCICGEEIRTVCLCIEKGVYIDMGEFEPNVPHDFKVDCPECGRCLIAFTCEKCTCAYTWQIGVVDNISE